MKFKMVHNNFNISDPKASIEFYEKALGLHVVRENEAKDGSFKIFFLEDDLSDWQLELTWLRDHPQKYDLGENEIHLCFRVEEYEEAHALHQEMGCICYENTAMGLYFINDPDGYWLEIVPVRR